MAPNSTVNLLRKMGKGYDSQMLKWKKTIEVNRIGLKLLKEIKDVQLPEYQEDDMEIERIVNINEAIVKQVCSKYEEPVVMHITELLTSINNTENNQEPALAQGLFQEDTFNEVISHLSRERIPCYK
jgi:hypothetical protein